MCDGKNHYVKRSNSISKVVNETARGNNPNRQRRYTLSKILKSDTQIEGYDKSNNCCMNDRIL